MTIQRWSLLLGLKEIKAQARQRMWPFGHVEVTGSVQLLRLVVCEPRCENDRVRLGWMKENWLCQDAHCENRGVFKGVGDGIRWR